MGAAAAAAASAHGECRRARRALAHARAPPRRTLNALMRFGKSQQAVVAAVMYSWLLRAEGSPAHSVLDALTFSAFAQRVKDAALGGGRADGAPDAGGEPAAAPAKGDKDEDVLACLAHEAVANLAAALAGVGLRSLGDVRALAAEALPELAAGARAGKATAATRAAGVAPGARRAGGGAGRLPPAPRAAAPLRWPPARRPQAARAPRLARRHARRCVRGHGRAPRRAPRRGARDRGGAVPAPLAHPARRRGARRRAQGRRGREGRARRGDRVRVRRAGVRPRGAAAVAAAACAAWRLRPQELRRQAL